MKLVYVKPKGEQEPSKELKRLFSSDPADISVFNVTPEQENPVREIELELEEIADLYMDDTFLLAHRKCEQHGRGMSRNAINFGVEVEHGGEGIIEMADSYIKPVRISRLPGERESRVLVVAVHPDNEVWRYSAWGHAQNRDRVKVLAATKDDPEYLEKMAFQYEESGVEYEFMKIPDTQLKHNKDDFIRKLTECIDGFQPDTIIQTPPGMNDDHNYAFDCTCSVIDGSGINFLLGGAIEEDDLEGEKYSRKANPTIWQIIDGKHLDKILESYADLGDLQYIAQVLNCVVKLPIGVSKLSSNLHKKGVLGPGMEAWEAVENMKSYSKRMPLNPIVGAFGHEVMNLKIDGNSGYRVPNVTDIFEYRHLTKL